MNERIRKLAEQAGFYYTDKTGFITPAGCDPAKFARLIVRECAHLVGGYTKENEFGSASDVKEAYEEITKHFGVEE